MVVTAHAKPEYARTCQIGYTSTLEPGLCRLVVELCKRGKRFAKVVKTRLDSFRTGLFEGTTSDQRRYDVNVWKEAIQVRLASPAR